MASAIKRVFDMTVAGAALIAGAPVLAVLAAAVKLDSRGPVLFRQIRVGRGGQPFEIVKLRTMTTGGDPDRAALITASGDRRVTRVGALLRRTKLDELPQLWNVVRGDMSIVGPRPEVPRYVAAYRPEWRPLLEVRPGLTDLASLTFRDEEGLLALARDRERAYTEVVMPLKLQVALAGLARSSFADDLRTIARTAAAIVRRRAPAEDPVIDEARRRIAELDGGAA